MPLNKCPTDFPSWNFPLDSPLLVISARKSSAGAPFVTLSAPPCSQISLGCENPTRGWGTDKDLGISGTPVTVWRDFRAVGSDVLIFTWLPAWEQGDPWTQIPAHPWQCSEPQGCGTWGRGPVTTEVLLPRWITLELFSNLSNPPVTPWTLSMDTVSSLQTLLQCPTTLTLGENVNCLFLRASRGQLCQTASVTSSQCPCSAF